MLKSMGDLSIVTVYTSGGYAGPMGGGHGSSSASSDAKLDDKALESFRSMSGVSGATPIMNFPYNVTAKAGAGGRYIYDHVQIMGIDMSQFEQMGYKMVDGSKPTTKDQVLAGEWFAYGFMDTLKTVRCVPAPVAAAIRLAHSIRPPANASRIRMRTRSSTRSPRKSA